jgi:arsenate reductase (glutaredoxin)
LHYLKEQAIEFRVVHYLDEPLTADDLKRIIMKLNRKPFQVIRTQEEMYRKELRGKSFTDDEWIDIIIQNPKLLQRPIVEGKYRAVVAVPAERIREVMG